MASKPFTLEAEKPMGDIYFHVQTEKYVFQSAGGRFLSLGSSDTKLHLQEGGMFVSEVGDNGLKHGERALLRAQIDRPVDYVGALAGHKIGPMSFGGKNFLITSQPQPTLAGPGESPNIERYMTEMFGAEQTTMVLLWLKFSRQSLAKMDWRPRQALALCGPAGAGKSLFQQFVTVLLGGRVGKPFDWMMGKTNFNADLCEAEHWCIEDESGSTDIRTRREFGQQIKQCVVNSLTRIHGKGLKGIQANIFKVLTISLNSESENMLILPPLDESIKEKIFLLKCDPISLGTKGVLSGDRKKDWLKFEKELPAFARQIDEMPCPKELSDVRYGSVHFHHPELYERLVDMSQETRLLEFIEQYICQVTEASRTMGKWEFTYDFRGTATELESELKRSPASFAVDRLLHFPSACGTYLSRLEKRMPERFSSVKNRGQTIWTIKGEIENDQNPNPN